MLQKLKNKFFKFLSKVFLLIELLLGIRFVLRFLGANEKTYIVNFFYRSTNFLIFLFRGIFSNVNWGGFTLDLVVLSAMVGYFLFFLILKKIFD